MNDLEAPSIHLPQSISWPLNNLMIAPMSQIMYS